MTATRGAQYGTTVMVELEMNSLGTIVEIYEELFFTPIVVVKRRPDYFSRPFVGRVWWDGERERCRTVERRELVLEECYCAGRVSDAHRKRLRLNGKGRRFASTVWF